MSTTFDVRALGSTVHVEWDDSVPADERQHIASQWKDLIAPTPQEPTHVVLGATGSSVPDPVPGTVIAFGRTAAELDDRLLSAVTGAGLETLSGEAVMLRATGIALDDGRVIAFVDPSDDVRSTIARDLGGEYGYVTDELLAVKLDGSVAPFPNPLSDGDGSSGGRRRSASELGLRPVVSEDLRLAAVVLLDRRIGASHAHVESAPLRESMPALMSQTVFLSTLRSPLRALAEVLISTGGVRRLIYSDSTQIAALIEDVLATVDTHPPPLSSVASAVPRDCDCFGELLPTSELAPGKPFEDARPGAHRREDHFDALYVGDELFVFRGTEVVVLAGIAPTIWLAADDSTADELLKVALLEFEQPPPGIDPAHVVSTVLDELVELRLLRRKEAEAGAIR